MAEDPVTAARFVEQIAGDYPTSPVELFPGVMFTRAPQPLPEVTALWLAQGQPRHRAVIVAVGEAFLDREHGWSLPGWSLDGTYCPGVAAVELETRLGVEFVRAFCGWHLPDLWRAALAPSPWAVHVGNIW